MYPRVVPVNMLGDMCVRGIVERVPANRDIC